ncbi:hypothetical protein ABZY04_34805, partial [Streptomyces sp. NPDC002922]
MGGRPTEAPDASGTPMPDASWDSRSEALVSETRVAEISAPAWGLPASGPGWAPAVPGLTGKGRTPVVPGLFGKGRPASFMGHFMGRDGSPDRGEGPRAPEVDPATSEAPTAETVEPAPAADPHAAPDLDRTPAPHSPPPTDPARPRRATVAPDRLPT